MTHKIYLIKHNDTGKGYVGITGDELGKRWYQHLHDKNGALYAALRAEGHRMTMELIEEVETREEALIKEQEYIHSLGTAQPAGWNRQVKPKRKSKQWIKHKSLGTVFRCPICKSDELQMRSYELFMRDTVDGHIHAKLDYPGIVVDKDMSNSINRYDVLFEGIRIEFYCWDCHAPYNDEENADVIKTAPYFHLEILNYRTNMFIQTVAFEEDKS
jgi:predicted GIY-YIG superfamily endonuclease